MSSAGEQLWVTLIGRVLYEQSLPSSKQDKAFISRIKRGLTPSTQRYAFADVIPYTENVSQELPLLRAAAIIANCNNVKQFEPSSEVAHQKQKYVGSTFFDLSVQLSDEPFILDPSKPDAVAARLLQLPNMELDEAALCIYRLFNLAKYPIYTDYFKLTRILLQWDHGISPESKTVRESILMEYYRCYTPQNPQANN